MYTRSSEWEEEKYFTLEHVRVIALKNYNNILTTRRWSAKYPKDSQILAIVGVAQNIADDS